MAKYIQFRNLSNAQNKISLTRGSKIALVETTTQRGIPWRLSGLGARDSDLGQLHEKSQTEDQGIR